MLQLLACLFFLIMRIVIAEKCVEIYLFGITATLLMFLFFLECQSHVKANFAAWHNPTSLKQTTPPSSSYSLLVITTYFTSFLAKLFQRSLLPSPWHIPQPYAMWIPVIQLSWYCSPQGHQWPVVTKPTGLISVLTSGGVHTLSFFNVLLLWSGDTTGPPWLSNSPVGFVHLLCRFCCLCS